MSTLTTSTDPVQFVVHEGRLLNEGRHEEWLSLFAPEGCYWVPLAGDRQSDPHGHASLAYEDRILLATRIRRLQGPRAHSLTPGVRSVHVLQQPGLTGATEDGCLLVQTPFHYTEARGNRQFQLAGVWCHRLRPTAQGLRIVLKRVNLVNATAAHEAIQLFP